jgi:hypothetical protein
VILATEDTENKEVDVMPDLIRHPRRNNENLRDFDNEPKQKTDFEMRYWEGQMKDKILIAISTFLIIAVLGVLIWPVISTVMTLFHGIVSVNRLESKMCSQEYYEPIGRDLTLVCSNIEYNTDEMLTVDNIWWPSSVRKLGPVYGSVSSDTINVLFTCGFSHLSYVLEKIPEDDNNSNRWKLSFNDEGRSKYLATIELSENESWNFDNMFQDAIQEYEYRLGVTDKSDLDTLKENKQKFFTLFGKKEKHDTSD